MLTPEALPGVDDRRPYTAKVRASMRKQTGISIATYRGSNGDCRVALLQFGEYTAVAVTDVNAITGNQNDSRKFDGSRRAYGNRGYGQSWLRVAGLDFIREAAERKRSLGRQSELRRFLAWCQQQGVSGSLWAEGDDEPVAAGSFLEETVFPYWVTC